MFGTVTRILYTASRLHPWIISGLLVFIAAINSVLYYVNYARIDGFHLMNITIMQKSIYNRGVIAFHYFNSGFIRRGLGGSIADLLSSDFFLSGIFFFMFSIMWMLLPLSLLLVRISARAQARNFLYVAFFFVFSPQTFLGWSADLMRTDFFVEGCILWAVLIMWTRYRSLASLPIMLGFLAHETALIFGIPLLSTIYIQLLNRGVISRKMLIVSVIGASVSTILIIALQFFFAPSTQHLTSVYAQLASEIGNGQFEEGINLSAYFDFSGLRGLKAAICENRHNARFIPNVLFCILILGLSAFSVCIRLLSPDFSLACVAPYLCMVLISTDTGRWLKFSVANASILGLVNLPTEPIPFKRMVLGSLILVSLLIMGPTHVGVANAFVDRIMDSMRLPQSKSGISALSECDPSWNKVLTSP